MSFDLMIIFDLVLGIYDREQRCRRPRAIINLVVMRIDTSAPPPCLTTSACMRDNLNNV